MKTRKKRLLTEGAFIAILVLVLGGCFPNLLGDASNPSVVIILSGAPSGVSPLELSLRADVVKASNEIVKYEWDFGDGSSPTFGASVTHTFVNESSQIKTYTILLTITDSCGRVGRAAQTVEVKPKPNPPRVLGISYRTSGECCMYVTLKASVSEDPVLYEWDFGDGQRSSLPSPTHRYSQVGFVDVSLRIKGQNGLWSDAYVKRIYVGCEGDICQIPCYPPCYDYCSLVISPAYDEFPVYTWQSFEVNASSCSEEIVWHIYYCGSLASFENYEINFLDAKHQQAEIKFHKVGTWEIQIGLKDRTCSCSCLSKKYRYGVYRL